MVLNSRPLTYVAAHDIEEPHTPLHLLIGRRLMSLPDHLLRVDNEKDENTCLYNHARHLNHTLDAILRRWRKEYLLELREAHCYHHSSGSPELSEGYDIIVEINQGVSGNLE